MVPRALARAPAGVGGRWTRRWSEGAGRVEERLQGPEQC